MLFHSQERVFDTEKGVEQVVLGLYVIRGDNLAVVGEVDEEIDSRIDLSRLRRAFQAAFQAAFLAAFQAASGQEYPCGTPEAGSALRILRRRSQKMRCRLCFRLFRWLSGRFAARSWCGPTAAGLETPCSVTGGLLWAGF